MLDTMHTEIDEPTTERFKGLTAAVQQATKGFRTLSASEALARKPAAGDPRIRSVEPTARKLRRVRAADTKSMFKKNRRATFRQQLEQQKAEQTLATWAKVYLDGRGNDHVRRNVTEAVHRQADLYSRVHGEPFTTSLKRVEGALLAAKR